MGLGIGKAAALGGQQRPVTGDRHATALEVGPIGLTIVLELQRHVGGVELPHPIRQVQLGRGPGGHTDRLTG